MLLRFLDSSSVTQDLKVVSTDQRVDLQVIVNPDARTTSSVSLRFRYLCNLVLLVRLAPRMRANQVGVKQGGEKSIMCWDFRLGRAFGIAYRRITVTVSLAILLGRELHGLERLRCPPVAKANDASRAYGCFPADSGCRRCRARTTPLRAASRASGNVQKTTRVGNRVLSGTGARRVNCVVSFNSGAAAAGLVAVVPFGNGYVSSMIPPRWTLVCSTCALPSSTSSVHVFAQLISSICP